jgi:hypothetical protein
MFMNDNCNLCGKKIRVGYDWVFDGHWMTDLCMSCRLKIGVGVLNNQLVVKDGSPVVKCFSCGELVSLKHVNIDQDYSLKCSNCLCVRVPINQGLIKKLQKVEWFQYLSNVLVVDGEDCVTVNDLNKALCDYLKVDELPFSNTLLGRYINELFNINGTRTILDGGRFTVFNGLSLVYQEPLKGLHHFSRFWLDAILGQSVRFVDKVVPKVVESVCEDEVIIDDGVNKDELVRYIKDAELKIAEYQVLLNGDYAHDQPILNLIEDEKADIEEFEETLSEFFDE